MIERPVNTDSRSKEKIRPSAKDLHHGLSAPRPSNHPRGVGTDGGTLPHPAPLNPSGPRPHRSRGAASVPAGALGLVPGALHFQPDPRRSLTTQAPLTCWHDFEALPGPVQPRAQLLVPLRSAAIQLLMLGNSLIGVFPRIWRNGRESPANPAAAARPNGPRLRQTSRARLRRSRF